MDKQDPENNAASYQSPQYLPPKCYVLDTSIDNKMDVHLKLGQKKSEDNQEILQSINTAHPRKQKKQRWRTNNAKPNATYERTDAQTKKNPNRRSNVRSKGARILRIFIYHMTSLLFSG